MKRIAWVLGAVVLAGVALFSMVVALLPREAITARMGQQIAAWTGREVSMRGEPEFRFFPALTITLKDVQVNGPEGMTDAGIASMERLEGRVRFWPLILGDVEIDSYTMVRPLIRLVRENGGRNWAFQSGAAALQLAFSGDVALGDFEVKDGTVIFENRNEDVTERLDSLNVQLQWPSVRQPLSVTGSAIWRGEPVAVSARANTPFAFLNGEATPMEARLDSARIAVAINGEWSNIEDPELGGRLTISTPSLRNFASWMGNPVGPGATLGLASLEGQGTYRARTLSVENAKLSLDGNSATGALNVKLATAPEITGTLDFPSIDLTPYFAGLATAFDAGEDWRTVDIETDWFGDFEADIRLSAGSVQIGQLRFGNTAASASLRSERLEIGVAQAAFNGGSVAGDLEINRSGDADPAVVAQLRATAVDLAQAGPALAIPWPLAGLASLAVDLAGHGRDFGSLASNLRGSAVFSVQGGSFPLFGMAEVATVRAAGTPPPVLSAAPTPLGALSAQFAFSAGMAHLEAATISAASFTADAKGSIGLLDGRLSLNGSAVPAPQGAAAKPVPFTIEGTLTQPQARALASSN